MNVSEEPEIENILEYYGFYKLAQQTITTADRFESYDDILTLGESDIVNLSKGSSDRTVATGKISFGLRRNNILKATIHWAQNIRRIS